VHENASTEPHELHIPVILDVKRDHRFTGDDALIDASVVPFFRISEVPFAYASSLTLRRERQPDLPTDAFRVVARSSPQTLHETSEVMDLRPLRLWRPSKVGEPFAQYDIGVIVTGKLRSAFPAEAGAPPAVGSRRPSRLLVLSSSQFFANPFARAQGGAPDDAVVSQLVRPYAQKLFTSSILVAKNTLDWMTTEDDLSACLGASGGRN
jgi:hypothetical protein